MEDVSAKSVEQDRPRSFRRIHLRELRLARGLSQYRLADMAGITQTMIFKNRK
jgi:predicted transcriptional regulator